MIPANFSFSGYITHLEGALGMASAIKTILMLEKDRILPTADFQELSPSIDAEHLRIKVRWHQRRETILLADRFHR